MKRSGYFAYIEEKLNILATRIQSRGRLNTLDLHLHSENFYAYFLNELYGWGLKNENPVKQNVEAIDLIDHQNKIVVQVSATNTKAKVEDSLKKELLKQYSLYNFKFVSIANDADDLRKKSFANPHSINFDPKNDVLDKHSILNLILGLEVEKQRSVFDFIKNELGSEVDEIKLESNLASIINILAKESWDKKDSEYKFSPFEINRKISHNELKITQAVIHEYKIYHHRVDEKYEEFDLTGLNKSYSILQLIGRFYIEECVKETNPDRIFLNIVGRVMDKVQESINFVKTEFEVLALCADILVVDAFIRCKIFENPENYNHATS
jgi:hypothetical protein